LNLLKSRFRRTTAIVAGAFIGLTGAFAFIAPASAHTGALTSTSECTDTGWKTTWTLTTTYTNGTDGVISNVESTGGGSPLTVFVNDGSVHGDGTFTAVQTFGKDVKSATLGFHLNWHDGRKDYPKDVWAEAKPKYPCTYPTQPTTPPTTPPPVAGAPTPTLDEDCTTITIGLDNPANGKTVTLDFKTSKGETRTTVVKPGENKSEKFSAVPGFTVTVTPTGFDNQGPETIAYEKPADCDTAGSGGGLPVTGAAAGSIAGGAGLLLAIGAVLFVVSRRRKVKFTA
jgi:LPXTG-motif cell wall-anchored protein